MARRIPEDHNYRTACPAAIKAKITLLERAAMDYGFAGAQHPAAIKAKITMQERAAMDYAFVKAQHPDDHDTVLESAQVARYDLERTILTCIDAAVQAALDPNTKRPK